MKRSALTLIAISTLSLSGCAQMMNFGDLMWTESKHAVSKVFTPVKMALRGKQSYNEPVFASHELDPIYASYPAHPTQYSAQAQQRVINTPRYAPPPALPQSAEIGDMPNLSYVKMGGGTSISDWQECQNMAGSYITPQGAGFMITPAFDGCMRAKGYIPEDEALAAMDSQIAP